ncbi:EXS family-domain-containing protein [Gloeopeniophorella convolvens]|nr:EXS family-domain-containing protein [Gloeopeniophorella convolvens]
MSPLPSIGTPPLASAQDAVSPQTAPPQPSAPPRNPPRLLSGLRKRSTTRSTRLTTRLPTPLTRTPVNHSTSVPSITQAPQPTLAQLLEPMPPIQLAFFDKLASELAKIEAFFIARETEARERSRRLRAQLDELKDHRRLFYEAHPADHRPWSLPFLPAPGAPAAKRLRRALHHPRGPIHVDEDDAAGGEKDAPGAHEKRRAPRLNPEEYQHARKRLKRAALEHYRGLEVLNNYRILNITGFRKALKKFEKLTKVPVQDVYMKEKVDPCAFASDQTVQELLKELEDQYTARFAKGDKKRALVRLRAMSSHKTHHFSSFRTGVGLGLALPAFVDGLVRSAPPCAPFLPHAPRHPHAPGPPRILRGPSPIPIPPSAPATQAPPRAQIPCIALTTLCWAFWLSFARAGAPALQPWAWPALWLLLVLLLLANPFPVLSRESRYWLVRKVARLLTSGFHRVEFTDFWLGDQFCSLAFPLGNLYFVACAYAHGFHADPYAACSAPAPWGVPFVLATLPFVARFVQSVRRWADSRLVTHLINGGKYLTGIVYYLCYYLWRHNGGERGTSFVFFCLLGTIYSSYASAWDLLMDWSLLRPRARFPFLRQELVYSSSIPLYYFAIVTNVLIRFIWVIYIPTRGPSPALRTWIAALLEMLRRCQWNVYRLENEHVGNVDQYRITREVPLPYSFDDLSRETDVGEDDEDEDARAPKITRSASKRRAG